MHNSAERAHEDGEAGYQSSHSFTSNWQGNERGRRPLGFGRQLPKFVAKGETHPVPQGI